MKPRLRTGFILMLLIGLSAMLSGCIGGSEEPDEATKVVDDTEDEMALADDSGVMLTCAYDGMRMKEQAMEASAEFRGETLHFCNDGHRDSFLQSPDKYRKVLDMANVEVTIWIMPADTHMEAMDSMGMKMHKMTQGHHVGAGVIDKRTGQFTRDARINLKISSSAGARDLTLRYRALLAHYIGDVSLPRSGTVKVDVEVEHDGQTDKSSFHYAIEGGGE